MYFCEELESKYMSVKNLKLEKEEPTNKLNREEMNKVVLEKYIRDENNQP